MMQFGPLTLKRCRYGWMLFSGPYIGKCFDLYGQYSESELVMMRAFLRPGDVVIDVGANIGDLTLPIAAFLGDSGRAYAIESHPEIFNVLCANLALNQVHNVRPINAFVATEGDADTSSAAWGEFAYVGKWWKPRFMAIDDLELDALTLIKVDVDGNELTVLRSASGQIDRFRPTLYVENDVRTASPALLAYLIDELRYDVYWHLAPIFDADNYFRNPNNHWGTMQITSVMLVCVPHERELAIPNLRRVSSPQDWWQAA